MTAAEIFAASFVTGFSGAMMPGPLLAVDITETTRHGWIAGFLCTLGHALAEIPVVIIFALGITVLTPESMAFRILSIVGGLALLAMAGLMVRDLLTNRVNYDQSSRGSSTAARKAVIGKGFMASIVNPYWIVWWATIGLGFVISSKEIGAVGPAVFYAGHISADLIWYSAVSFLVWSGRRLILGKPLKIFLYCCAAFLIYLGVTFIASAINSPVR